MSESVRPSSPSLFLGRLNEPNTTELGREWRRAFLDRSIQKYKKCNPPKGFEILYAIVKRGGNKKAYIGKSKNRAVLRFRCHIRGVRDQRSCIHNALRKYGRNAFKFFILALVPSEQIDNAERNAIKKFNTYVETRGGYNIMHGGEGGPVPAEVLQNMKIAAIKRITPDVRQRMSDGAKRRLAADPEHIKRARNALEATDWRANLSTKAKERFAIPENRAAHKERQKVALSTDSARANMSAAGQRRRQLQLDACSTEAERDALRAEFKEKDKRNAKVALKRAMKGPRVHGQ
tara:strand:+ start:424 stop:1296 length:873 start_codon:yes stop_codon:yes gene_type:complete